jgi:CTP synthase
MQKKFIFITGGVCSSLGKGITTSSIGALLKAGGLKVFTIKLDPYLNVDPGTMSPYQHGEVFVTEDGGETDLDLGHYERFIDEPLTKLSSITSGKIYKEVIDKERQGAYLGGTIQIIPHVTNLIKEKLYNAQNQSKADVVLAEVGGTVGDIEGPHFIETMRQIRHELGAENVVFVHVTLLPYLNASKELKTKPTQASIRVLRSLGIQPDFLIARADLDIEEEHLDKISLFGDLKKSHVIPMPTLDNIYKVPLHCHRFKLGQKICDKLKLENYQPNIDQWLHLEELINKPTSETRVGIVGKYTALKDAYLSVIESIKIAAYHAKKKPIIEWIEAEEIENGTYNLEKLKDLNAIVVPGGFGMRGTKGKLMALEFTKKNNIPTLGICLGMQLMCIQHLRETLQESDLTSEEFEENYSNKQKPFVIHFLPGQNIERAKGGTLRLGNYKCDITQNTKTFDAYKAEQVLERHRHRYEFNNYYKQDLENSGMIVSGINPDSSLVEIVELSNHKFYVGCQFHPEFKSRPNKPHPLFLKLINS